MGKLNIGVEVRDFDLERMGFSLSVLDDTKKRQSSEAYLRMTLTELNTFLKALKAAPDEIEVCTVESLGRKGLQGVQTERPVQRGRLGRGDAGGSIIENFEPDTANTSMRAAE
jgi:hypothetical protein